MPRIIFCWLPRVLAVLFIAFLSLFALDVFQKGIGPLQTAIALAMHLIPSLVLLIAVILAWRWAWIGALFFGAAGIWVLYPVWVKPLLFYQTAPRHQVIGSLMIAGPALLIAVLFLVGWVMRRRIAGGASHPT